MKNDSIQNDTQDTLQNVRNVRNIYNLQHTKHAQLVLHTCQRIYTLHSIHALIYRHCKQYALSLRCIEWNILYIHVREFTPCIQYMPYLQTLQTIRAFPTLHRVHTRMTIYDIARQNTTTHDTSWQYMFCNTCYAIQDTSHTCYYFTIASHTCIADTTCIAYSTCITYLTCTTYTTHTNTCKRCIKYLHSNIHTWQYIPTYIPTYQNDTSKNTRLD